MKMKLLYLLHIHFLLFSFAFSQRLPLEIGNEWHYYTGYSPAPPFVAVAVDSVPINGNIYFKIEHREPVTNNLLNITYDRFVGDSCYYRLIDGHEELIINFNWEEEKIFLKPDTNNPGCTNIQILHHSQKNIWGTLTDIIFFDDGIYCEGNPDTAWALSGPEVSKSFGTTWSEDGSLWGAVINGISYGNLHPLAVELLSFSADVVVKEIHLNWITATEENNRGFEVGKFKGQSSKDKAKDEVWETVGFVKGKGTSTELNYYSFKDENLYPGKYFYRLKQIDFDGSFEYSNEIEVEIGMPDEFVLYQNYPNPFNPTTKIKFTIPDFGFTTLKIYDVLGNEIATLVNEEKSPGNYSVEFNAGKLASGVYIYTLKAGAFRGTKKLVLLK